jgi:uncharacterized protein
MRRTTITAGAAALLALAAGTAAAQPGMPMQPMTSPTIRVTATGDARTVPDRAFIDFGVETQAATARQAAEENAARMERVIAALVRAGVPRADIQTRDYNVFPVYAQQPRDEGEPRVTGYRVMNTVAVQTDEVRRVGALMDAALAAGANRVAGIRFGLRDPERARAEAIREALTRARAEAETIAQGLGVRLGRVLDASTTSTPPPFYPMLMAEQAADMRRMSTPVEPGQQTVNATVSVVFAIEG